MNDTSRMLFKDRVVEDDAGNRYPLHSETSEAQCRFLQDLIMRAKPRISLEVGCAYGISSVAICEALRTVYAQKHILIDPFQNAHWKNIGLKHLKDAGYSDLIEFYEDYSYNILPDLTRKGEKVDFAYWDSTKVFDYIIVDIFYMVKLLRVGGILILDDCGFPSINKACRFLSKHPAFRVMSQFGAFKASAKHEAMSAAIKYLHLPKKLFANHIIETNRALNVNAHCLCFQKIKDDNRPWNWHEVF